MQAKISQFVRGRIQLVTDAQLLLLIKHEELKRDTHDGTWSSRYGTWPCKVLTSVNYRTVFHLLCGNPAPCSTQDGTDLNACWIINCIPKFTMDLLDSFSSFTSNTRDYNNSYVYIYKNYLLSFMELLVNIFCNYFLNLLFNFDQNVNAGVVLREETIKNPHQQSPLFCHLYCFTLISPALKFIRLLQQFPSYILQWVMLHGRNDVFYFCITFFRNFIILERCSFQRWN